MDDYRERARTRAKERQVGSWFKMKEGENTFRILPTPPSSKKLPPEKQTPGVFMEYGRHRDVGPKRLRVRCGIDPVSEEGDCYICKRLIPKLLKLGKAKRAQALQPQNVLVLQVAKVDDDGKMTGPFVFEPSKKVGNALLSTVLGSKKRNYVDPKNGYNLTISRTGTGQFDTEYGAIVVDTDPSEVPEKLVTGLKPFSALVEIPQYDEAKQKAAYTGDDAPEEDEDEEEEDEDLDEELEEEDEEEEQQERRPKKKAAPVKSKRGRRAEPEEDEEEEEDLDLEDEEEPEEEETPKKKKAAPAAKAKSKRQAEPEEEEELEEDDADLDFEADEEEEEEERPKAKLKKGAAPAAPAKKKKAEPEEEDEADELDLDEAESEELEEEEEAPPPRRKLPPAKKRR